MQRLRTTFKRSRTPTPQDMKTQSSLEVPKQVRSASFDEIQLEAARGSGASVLLAVPQHGGRSRSFDSAGSDDSGTYLEVPRLWSRRRSGKTTPPACVHCRHEETWKALQNEERNTPERLPASSSAEDDDDDDESDVETPRVMLAPPPPPRTFLPPPPHQSPPPSPGAPSFELQPPSDEPPVLPQRRRSISRQEAFFVEPTGSSLENVRASEDCATQTTRDPLVHDIYLAVPELKRDRAASVDSCFSKLSGGARAEELSGGGDSLTVPGTGLRSRSVDIVLPTAEQSRYKALALTSTQAPPQIQSEVPDVSDSAVHSLDGRSYVNPFEGEVKQSSQPVTKKSNKTSTSKAGGTTSAKSSRTNNAQKKTAPAPAAPAATELFGSDTETTVPETEYVLPSPPLPTRSAPKRRCVFLESDDDDDDVEKQPLRAAALRSFLSRRAADGDYILQSDHTRRGEFYIECRLYNTAEIEPPALQDQSQRWKKASTTFKCSFNRGSPTFKSVIQLIAAAKEELRNVQPISYPSNTF